MFELLLIFSMLSSDTDQMEDFLSLSMAHSFESQTGCYLSGQYAIRLIAESDAINMMPPNTVISIACIELSRDLR